MDAFNMTSEERIDSLRLGNLDDNEILSLVSTHDLSVLRELSDRPEKFDSLAYQIVCEWVDDVQARQFLADFICNGCEDLLEAWQCLMDSEASEDVIEDILCRVAVSDFATTSTVTSVLLYAYDELNAVHFNQARVITSKMSDDDLVSLTYMLPPSSQFGLMAIFSLLDDCDFVRVESLLKFGDSSIMYDALHNEKVLSSVPPGFFDRLLFDIISGEVLSEHDRRNVVNMVVSGQTSYESVVTVLENRALMLELIEGFHFSELPVGVISALSELVGSDVSELPEQWVKKALIAE